MTDFIELQNFDDEVVSVWKVLDSQILLSPQHMSIGRMILF